MNPGADPFPRNPALVRVLRGEQVESVHHATWVHVDVDGRVLGGAGEHGHPHYVRSAIKCVQALPLLESGAADACGLGTAELALALASHNGEPQHTRPVAELLERLGLSEQDLGCGPQPPGDPETRADLAARGLAPGALHNNCSGKHAGFLALARHLGADPAGYLDSDGPVQRLVRRAVVELCDTPDDRLTFAVDGCSAPTWRLPLRGLATAFARVGTPDGLAPERAAACRRLTGAAALHPELVAGRHKRVCSALLRVGSGRLFPKIGAEGVYAVAHVGRGEALALKVDDGGARGLHALLLALLERLGWLGSQELEALRPFAPTEVRNWAGRSVGRVEVDLAGLPAGPLST